MHNHFPYQDILHLQPPTLPERPHLSAAQRAAQFAPYKTITEFHDSTDQLETDSDQPETEIIFDDIQAEIDEDLYFDIFPAEDIYPEDNFFSSEDITEENTDNFANM